MIFPTYVLSYPRKTTYLLDESFRFLLHRSLNYRINLDYLLYSNYFCLNSQHTHIYVLRKVRNLFVNGSRPPLFPYHIKCSDVLPDTDFRVLFFLTLTVSSPYLSLHPRPPVSRNTDDFTKPPSTHIHNSTNLLPFLTFR